MKHARVILGIGLVALALLLASRKIVAGPSSDENATSPAVQERFRIRAAGDTTMPRPARIRDREPAPEASSSKGWTLGREIERVFPRPGLGFVAEARHEPLDDGAEQWTIRTFVSGDGFDALLKVMSHDGIHKVFDRIHAETGDASFATGSSGSSLFVATMTIENRAYDPEAAAGPEDEAAFPMINELRVTRR